MNVSKLSNDELIEAMNAIEMTQAGKVLITEAQLRLAQNGERDLALMHIVPETVMYSFVENVSPDTKMSLGEVYQIIEAALMVTASAVKAGRTDALIKNAMIIKEARELANKTPIDELIARLRQ